ncbi:5' exonuclease Apollo [Amphibalanus amphitrite]|uniref:5' exonuclease Apollo n=1 Tax=Amphibalanus amphitrite TaxID=1232801 RepID=A0A6A4V1U7_AMPAM|nr:5' exonuclease Apollo [Amphibalanus amphitrite]
MNGHVIVPNLIAVDFWKESAALPPHLLVELPLGETTAVDRFQVTALDARHCPGSIVLLFQGDFGSILYTGDLRFWPGLLDEPALQYVVSGPGLDRLYLDNTYCSPDCVFPRREEVLEQVIRYLREWDDCDIYIGMRELGKEDAVLAIAEALQTDVIVSKSRLRLLECCAPSPRWTTDPHSGGRLRLVPFRQIAEYGSGSTDTGRQRVALLLTALYVGSQLPAQYSGGRVQVFPYSDHSSFPELCELVRRARPRRVLPLVNRWAARGGHTHRDHSARANMAVFRTYLRLDSEPPPLVPPADGAAGPADGAAEPQKARDAVSKAWSGGQCGGRRPCPFLLVGGRLVRMNRVLCTAEEVKKWLTSCGGPVEAPERRRPGAARGRMAAPAEPDLSHLTEDERRIIEMVMERQRREEDKENEVVR